jgi:hypothetical protein
VESRRSWTGEQRRAADLEECGLVGEQFGLGAVLGAEHQLGRTRYEVIARLCSAIGGLTVLGAIVLRFTRYGGWLWVLAGIAGGTAVAIIGAILIDVHRSRADVTERMAVYDDGVAQLPASSPDPSVVTWDDLDSVYVSLVTETDSDDNTILTPALVGCWVRSRRGTWVPAHDGLVELAARTAYRAAAPRIAGAMIAAYDAWKAVTAGQVQVDAAAITLADGSRLEWSSMRGVALAHPSSASPDMTTLVTITAPDPRNRRGSVTDFPLDPAGIPNAIFLADLIAHAARQHGVPVYGQASGAP